jgi:RNA polymerase sigma-70 factor (ECF subfamily)
MKNDDLNELSARARDLRGEFLDMIEPSRPALWRYCYRLTASPWDAEDLVQDTLVRAFGRLAQNWQPAKPRSYLFRIATNAWLDSRGGILAEPIDESQPPPMEVAGVPLDETVAALDYLSTLLPPRQAVVVVLADVFDFRLDEVAEMLSVSRVAAKALLQRARWTLRRANVDPPAAVAARRTPPPDGFAVKYIDAFNRRDPDGIAALLHEDVCVEMFGVVGDLHGRTFTREDALRQWAADPRPQWAEAGEFAGKPVMFVFIHDAAGKERLHRISRFLVDDGQALRSWEYYMTPELLTVAATALGIEPDLHGYMFDELT